MFQDLTGTYVRPEGVSFRRTAAVALLIFVAVGLVTLSLTAGLLVALFESGAKGTVEDISLLYSQGASRPGGPPLAIVKTAPREPVSVP
jgi:hypothetical protein